MSADIRTKYKLESTTITKREGGSSVKVSTKYGKSAKLEIFVSTNRHKCSCALITDFPKQLVEALELEPDGLPDLLPLLQVPLVSLKAFLVRKGITGRDAADDDEETIVADSAVGSTSRTDGSSDDSGDNTSTTSANRTSSDSVAPNVAEFAHASARSEAANPTLRPHTEHRPSSRSTTPEPRSRDHPNLSSNESPHERPVTPLPTAAGPYSTDNRNRNRERLQGFAQNANPASSSRPERPSGQSGSGDGAFDVSALREALGTVEPTPVSTPVQFNPSPRRRGRLIPNRNEVEMARDFEVGFLGEQFVSLLDMLA
jgi:hypothetical protein